MALVQAETQKAQDQAQAQAQAQAKAAQEQSCSAKHVNILVAEDDIMCQLVAKRLLSKLGHSVTIAKNGAKAVEEVVSGKPFDFILMDVEMPEMNGLEATERIRQFEHGTRRTPIVAYTTNNRSRCIDADMDDHLLKPASLESLQTMIALFTGR
ncbi:hypothetical protein SAMD00019534_056340 [Acytostelium subglobosum LB1]|uniref:hypothetical protein n=1 Tax=Acytostelium subglobosum LB1 TaxID=1410327 RepID=UPI000644916F|nr:hypothetical protein SAMD00019534_056340 [Acytostelium subglobosum LB1]GAM22459.1 hypothetical protein SAMD00019534_056340 [Acytostelium subglobosum LB1]|eukprot:XP_012754579.1 hypothetical protein SAMD00019534_056340 [Acytostelium subglobosum LB1]